MELRHLRYFVAVAEELHFTRAAARLGIAQPPLSQQIQDLEHELGLELFHRIKRHVVLTDAGRVFLDEARATLATLQAGIARTRRARDGLIGRIRIGFTESASFNPVVTDSIRDYRAAWPDVEVALTESHTTELSAALIAGTIDAAFVRPPLAGAGLQFRSLGREAMVAALPSSHRLAVAEPARLADLAGETFILYPRATRAGLSDLVVAAGLGAGFAVKEGQQAPQLSAAINLVAAGLGISVVPASMQWLKPAGVFYRPLKDGPFAELGLAWRREEQARAVLNFVDQTA
jgi:DNA-binding transcriptional LysR family regulator